jgi:hypothetical protein
VTPTATTRTVTRATTATVTAAIPAGTTTDRPPRAVGGIA